jgi:hypothetical protein
MFSRRWPWVMSGLFVLAAIAFFAMRRHGPETESSREASLSNEARRRADLALNPQTLRTTQPNAGQSQASVEAVKAFRASRDKKPNKFEHRLSNTTASVDELARSENSILLANALLDTRNPVVLNIPEHLRSKGDPGSYIVQSKGPLDDRFRRMLAAAGVTIVSYIPNNAYLVRAAKEAA